MKLGDSASVTRAFTPEDVAEYVRLGGETPPPGTAPEALVGALFSKLLGVDLPGLGTNYLKQDLVFSRAPLIGEALTASVTITRLRPDKHLADLETVCIGYGGDVIACGRALVFVQDVVG